MKRAERERLEDIRDAILAIRAHAASTDLSKRLRRDAILYNLVIVGEAVKGLDTGTTARRPEIPWGQVAGLRDLLTHEYFRIDMTEIDKIIEHDLGPLEAAINDLLART